jgi:hypothetical protein
MRLAPPGAWRFDTESHHGALVKQSIYLDISDFFKQERLPLHALVGSWYDGNSDICEDIFTRLVNAGADLETWNGTGDTPLFCLFPKKHAWANI